jgi:3-dehydroquinate dehydratase-1
MKSIKFPNPVPIAAIVDRPLPVSRLRALERGGVDLFEVRADLFPTAFAKTLAYVKLLRKAVRCPLIGTIRETRANRADRLRMFGQLMPYVDIVDIEIDAAINREVVRMAHAAKKTVMVSVHDFARMPADAGLRAIERTARQRGADIVKIAGTARSPEDALRLLEFCRSRKRPMAAIAMGQAGGITRLIAPFFGSLFTYGYIEFPVAPGQISAADLLKDRKRYFGSR